MRNEIIVTYCFYCPLIEDETLCTNKEVHRYKALFERVKSHDNSTTHINSVIAYKTLGKVNIASQLYAVYDTIKNMPIFLSTSLLCFFTLFL